ncbi:haloacid dehalogenase [Lichtheimia corymbifera JMRC:FSU:9682]|uniref:Haloacid dehalogenase n=1 Tax=Lichtheimia corymbifera JMRC:FSU:9682 TaxID=1263082 RepID=A0A068SF76_9FUNG|nr:haloacid dehalogenase [Lichtheimia corymbifera JMRC:FSU:9682]
MPAVAFDILGTLFTFDKVVACLQETFNELASEQAAKHLFRDWFSSGTRDFFGTSHAGRYIPLLKVLKSTLTRAMLIAGYDAPSLEQIEAVMKTFNELEPAVSALDALALFQEKGWDIWIVTNGSHDTISRLLERAGLFHFFRQGSDKEINVMSCDDLGISKPHPKVYSELMRIAVHRTQRIENFYLISSHAWDLAGAKNVCFRTAFLTTEEKIYPKDLYDGTGPDIKGDTMLSCAKAMVELESNKKSYM